MSDSSLLSPRVSGSPRTSPGRHRPRACFHARSRHGPKARRRSRASPPGWRRPEACSIPRPVPGPCRTSGRRGCRSCCRAGSPLGRRWSGRRGHIPSPRGCASRSRASVSESAPCRRPWPAVERHATVRRSRGRSLPACPRGKGRASDLAHAAAAVARAGRHQTATDPAARSRGCSRRTSTVLPSPGCPPAGSARSRRRSE